MIKKGKNQEQTNISLNQNLKSQSLTIFFSLQHTVTSFTQSLNQSLKNDNLFVYELLLKKNPSKSSLKKAFYIKNMKIR